jgi:predicted Zn-dependent peptidase
MTPEEVIAAVEAVTVDDVHRMAAEIFEPEQLSVTVLGELDGFQSGAIRPGVLTDGDADG